jgi:4-amino-4-deoxy-L-arabinose transferase-like glycosyltransferase
VRTARAGEGAAVLLLLAAMAALLLAGRAGDGMTNDEIIYIAAGHRHLTASDYRLNPNQPPLGKLVIATALVGRPWREPPLAQAPDEMEWAYRFVHVENSAAALLGRARVPVILVTLLLAGLTWVWARQAAGTAPALLALGLVAFHPSLLAHGHLATTDVTAAAAMLLASWAGWRWWRDPDARWAALSAAALGAAVATRLTGWLLLPCLAVIALWPAARPAGAPRPRPRARWLFLALLLLLPPLVVWAAYRFHYAPWPGEPVTRTAPVRPGVAARAIEEAERLRLFPEAYLEGARYQVHHGTFGHPAYLMGERSRTGWPHYFLVAFAVKNTPGFLLVTAAGLALAWFARRDPERRAMAWHCGLPAAAVFLAASAGRVQIGERYILSVYPYLALLAATMIGGVLARPAGRLALAAALAAHVGPAVLATRHGHLTYFNLLAGGPFRGHRVLLDSNLDWGQDLPRLARWMKERGVARVQLGYHGADDPGRFGIDHEDLPGLHLYPARPPAAPFQGVVAVSPNLLCGVFPRLRDPYAALRARAPDDRAGIFLVYLMNRPSAAAATR